MKMERAGNVMFINHLWRFRQQGCCPVPVLSLSFFQNNMFTSAKKMFCLDVLIIAFYACLWNVKDNPDQAYYFDLIIHQATVEFSQHLSSILIYLLMNFNFCNSHSTLSRSCSKCRNIIHY